jgi:hypothetical protein
MSEVRHSDYFAIVPEYVILANISANAVRLFAILNRYANKKGQAWPSRKTLAQLMEISVATVDRAKDELIGIGALTVEHRTGPNGDPTSNIYTLVMSSPMRRGSPTDGGTGSPTNDALTKANVKQSQLAKTSPARTCAECLDKYRTGYDDGTEGLSHIWEDMGDMEFPGQGTRRVGRYVVCPECDGSGHQ